ncbi:Gfo/Idh/MocA family protein [Qipengyuania sediminis]|uniref:Gfo/Idh/MocA family protein n=1 Tax=Qipengyuania sediminis TaxID=1532023 RepID=UPI00105A06F0|nr:Gfo/Idh/MocA family oxidoreductase [Qipengyuania sediminis]
MTIAPPLRAAVIGCGAIAYEHLPFVANAAHVTPVGLCDRSRALALAAARHFGLAVPLYTDAEEMLAAVKPEIVHILTPPHTHDPLVRAALGAGAHVICEKPMTGSAAETKALLAAAAEAGKVLVESRNLLWNDPVLALMRLVRRGELGAVRECDILLSLDFLSGPFGDTNLAGGVGLPGGAVHDFLPHLVYLFQSLTAVHDVEQVLGDYTNRSGNPRAGYDFCDVLLRAGPVRGRLRVATDVEPSAFRVHLRGSAASVETDLYNPFLRFEGEPDTGKRYPIGQLRAGAGLIRAGLANLKNKIGQHGTTHGLPRMLEAVYGAIRQGAPPPIAPDEMLATARLTDQILALRSPA